MKIKSLLIGSAAIMGGVSAAQAADMVVVPEPEPMEYVRVCDVYGAGFFYIPGTETCLKIGGYVRYQIDWSEDDDGFRKLARGNVTIDARSETEYGTLGSLIELRGNAYSGYDVDFEDIDPDLAPLDDISAGILRGVYINQAYITLGGMFMGYKTTIFDQGLSGEFDKGGFDSSVHTIGYTFDAANGVYVSVALEEFDNNFDYTPNVVGNIGVAQGWGSAAAWAVYDATAEEWGAKGYAGINATQQLQLQLLATYFSGDSVYDNGYEWSAGAYLKYAATPKLSLGFGGQYFSDKFTAAGNNDWALGAVVDYALVENFNTKLAVNYNDGDSYDDGVFSGFIRFDRNF